MSERVTIPTSTGEVSGVLELPPGNDKAPGVVVLQEWWGIDEKSVQAGGVRAVARRWAEAGFIAIVPDLFHGKFATTAEEAGALMKALDFPKAIGEVAASVAYLKGHARSTGKVAVTGYCLGGALSLATAVNVRGLSCVVPYYGLPGDLDWSKVDAPVQAHFATHDEWATVAGAEKVKAGVKSMELHTYDAQHAFCNDKRPEVFNADACGLAWKRTLEFVKRHTA